jgi:hypothetical protein
MSQCYLCAALLSGDFKGIGWLCAACAADYEKRNQPTAAAGDER